MKHDVDQHERWSPKKTWLAVRFHPATPGSTYLVKYGDDGTPFTAHFSYSGSWYKVLPDSNGDGTRELGEKLTSTFDLYWETIL